MSYRGLSLTLLVSSLFSFSFPFLRFPLSGNPQNYTTTSAKLLSFHFRVSSTSFRFSLLLDQALDLLVPVSSNCLQPSTSGLSPCRLQGVLLLSNGISRLEGGFTLRCLQRLSLPDLATLLCVWYATDAPAVCPFRSSRTKNSSSQISYAHDG